ncbi:hypothetical protein SDJN03_09710, partial [Cucurbita argyrosperma subsp. sororia]
MEAKGYGELQKATQKRNQTSQIRIKKPPNRRIWSSSKGSRRWVRCDKWARKWAVRNSEQGREMDVDGEEWWAVEIYSVGMSFVYFLFPFGFSHWRTWKPHCDTNYGSWRTGFEISRLVNGLPSLMT